MIKLFRYILEGTNQYPTWSNIYRMEMDSSLRLSQIGKPGLFFPFLTNTCELFEYESEFLMDIWFDLTVIISFIVKHNAVALLKLVYACC